MALSSPPGLGALLHYLVDLMGEGAAEVYVAVDVAYRPCYSVLGATADALEQRGFGTRTAEARIGGSAVTA